MSHDTRGRNGRIQQVQYVGWDSGFFHSLSLLKDNMYIYPWRACLVTQAATTKNLAHSYLHMHLHQCSLDLVSVHFSLFPAFEKRRRKEMTSVLNSFILFLSRCCLLVNTWCIFRTADLYAAGSASFNLDKRIQSQETKVIPTLCPSLAQGQRQLSVRVFGSVWCHTVAYNGGPAASAVQH